jgi:hypothetical protein
VAIVIGIIMTGFTNQLRILIILKLN